MREKVIKILQWHIIQADALITKRRRAMVDVDPDVKTGDADETPGELLDGAIAWKAELEDCLEWVRGTEE